MKYITIFHAFGTDKITYDVENHYRVVQCLSTFDLQQPNSHAQYG